MCFDVMHAALVGYGAPVGTLGLVYGTTAGARLVAHPAVKAVGFTGSLSGGRALLEVIAQRDEPIPFHGELSSINPVIVTPAAAAAERAEEIGAAAVASFTLGAGQLCTKPGVVLIPSGADGDRLVAAARAALAATSAGPLLNDRIHQEYLEHLRSLPGIPGVSVRFGEPAPPAGFQVTAALCETGLDDFGSELAAELRADYTAIPRRIDGVLVPAGDEDR